MSEKVECPNCDGYLNKSGKCVPCRNLEIIEGCKTHCKTVRNYASVSEFEKSICLKVIYEESGLARLFNPILELLNKEVEAGIFVKEKSASGANCYSLVGIPIPEIEEVEKPKKPKSKKVKSVPEEIDEEEDDEEDDEESEEEEDEEEVVVEEEVVEETEQELTDAMKQYEEETGNKVITTRGDIRKDFVKWKKKNWD